MSFFWTCIGCGGTVQDPWDGCPFHVNVTMDWEPILFVVRGSPVSQKNAKKIGRRGKGGVPFVLSDPKVRSWRKHAALSLHADRLAMKIDEPMGGNGRELAVNVAYYLGKGQRIDCDNAAGAPLDALQDAGVITSDYWVNPLRVERMRDEKDPRVEIYIRPSVLFMREK